MFDVLDRTLLNSGTTDFEVSLLRLLEKVTNGTIIEISVTGTSLNPLASVQVLRFNQVPPSS